MKDIKVKIGEREIPLYFGMDEFIQIEEEIGFLGDVKELILKGKKRVRNLIGCIRVMGNAGLALAGEKADLTDEWLKKHMDPYMLMGYQAAVIACLTRDGESEAATENSENEERDLVLEEINAKKDPVNSRPGA